MAGEGDESAAPGVAAERCAAVDGVVTSMQYRLHSMISEWQGQHDLAVEKAKAALQAKHAAELAEARQATAAALAAQRHAEERAAHQQSLLMRSLSLLCTTRQAQVSTSAFKLPRPLGKTGVHLPIFRRLMPNTRPTSLPCGKMGAIDSAEHELNGP